jgi:hypothetical protein
LDSAKPGKVADYSYDYWEDLQKIELANQ